MQKFLLVSLIDHRLKMSEPMREKVWFGVLSFENANLLVMRGQNIFPFKSYLLEELFTGPQANDPDFDVLIRHESGKLNHVMSQIQDADRFAHIEYEDIRFLSHG